MQVYRIIQEMTIILEQHIGIIIIIIIIIFITSITEEHLHYTYYR
jgi:hypothetical protein